MPQFPLAFHYEPKAVSVMSFQQAWDFVLFSSSFWFLVALGIIFVKRLNVQIKVLGVYIYSKKFL